ncbi:MAG: hypothetical protein WCF65_09595 [Parachlamydiaceae bacterium]
MDRTLSYLIFEREGREENAALITLLVRGLQDRQDVTAGFYGDEF